MKKFLVVENTGCRNEDDMFVNTTLQVLGEADTVDEAVELGFKSLTTYAKEQFDYLLDDGEEEEYKKDFDNYMGSVEQPEVNYTDSEFPVMRPVPVLELDWTDGYDYYREFIQIQVIKLKED